jgi:hypothetical protein
MTLSWVGCQQDLGGLIENGELSAALRKLEAVAPSDPITPVADGLAVDSSGSMALSAREDCHLAALPTDLHKHVVLAPILHGHL